MSLQWQERKGSKRVAAVGHPRIKATWAEKWLCGVRSGEGSAWSQVWKQGESEKGSQDGFLLGWISVKWLVFVVASHSLSFFFPAKGWNRDCRWGRKSCIHLAGGHQEMPPSNAEGDAPFSQYCNLYSQNPTMLGLGLWFFFTLLHQCLSPSGKLCENSS